MPWTAEEIYYRDLDDAAFVAAYLFHRDDWKRTGSDAAYREMLLIGDVATAQNRWRLIVAAVKAEKERERAVCPDCGKSPNFCWCGMGKARAS